MRRYGESFVLVLILVVVVGGHTNLQTERLSSTFYPSLLDRGLFPSVSCFRFSRVFQWHWVLVAFCVVGGHPKDFQSHFHNILLSIFNNFIALAFWSHVALLPNDLCFLVTTRLSQAAQKASPKGTQHENERQRPDPPPPTTISMMNLLLCSIGLTLAVSFATVTAQEQWQPRAESQWQPRQDTRKLQAKPMNGKV